MAINASFLQANGSASNLTTYTFSSENLGTADAARYIVVIAHANSGTTTVTLSSVSVGGVAASIVVQLTVSKPGAGFGSVSGIAIAAVPSGTTGDVVVTFSHACARARIELFRLVGIDSATASDSDSSGALDPSVALDVPAGGVAIGGSQNVSAASVASWTGLTERSEGITEATMVSTAAHDVFVAQQVGLTITVDWDLTSNSTNALGVFASWAEAAAGGDPEGSLVGGKLIRGGLLLHGVLGR